MTRQAYANGYEQVGWSFFLKITNSLYIFFTSLQGDWEQIQYLIVDLNLSKFADVIIASDNDDHGCGDRYLMISRP